MNAYRGDRRAKTPADRSAMHEGNEAVLRHMARTAYGTQDIPGIAGHAFNNLGNVVYNAVSLEQFAPGDLAGQARIRRLAERSEICYETAGRLWRLLRDVPSARDELFRRVEDNVGQAMTDLDSLIDKQFRKYVPPSERRRRA